MVITNADKDPEDSNVIIFRSFISFVGLTDSRETTTHMTAETIAIMATAPLDIFDHPFELLLFKF